MPAPVENLAALLLPRIGLVGRVEVSDRHQLQSVENRGLVVTRVAIADLGQSPFIVLSPGDVIHRLPVLVEHRESLDVVALAVGLRVNSARSRAAAPCFSSSGDGRHHPVSPFAPLVPLNPRKFKAGLVMGILIQILRFSPIHFPDWPSEAIPRLGLEFARSPASTRLEANPRKGCRKVGYKTGPMEPTFQKTPFHDQNPVFSFESCSSKSRSRVFDIDPVLASWGKPKFGVANLIR